jgi:hypothetical protein
MTRDLMAATLLAAAALPLGAGAATFPNVSGDAVEFPAGAVSFADELVEFVPGLKFDAGTGALQPLPQYREGANTLGIYRTSPSSSSSTAPLLRRHRPAGLHPSARKAR